MHRIKEMTALYWTNSLRATATAFVAVLVPIYLLKIGYSLDQIFLVFIAEGLVWLVILYPVMRVIHKVGTNLFTALGVIMLIGLMVSLALLPLYSWLIVAAVFFKAMGALYWFALRLNFTAVTNGKEAGKNIGLTNALFLMCMGVAPAIGGIVAQLYGMNWAYFISITIILLACVPMLDANDVALWPKADLSKLNIRKILPDLIANAGSTIDDSVGALVWPLLIFIIIPSYAGVGILSAIVVISAIIISLWVGWREGKKGEAHYLKQGSLIMSATNFLRLLTQTVSQVAGINLLSGIGQALYTTPLASRYYKNAAREPTLEYIYAMQVVSAIAWFGYPLILFCLTFILPDKQVLIFGALLAIPATWAIRFIRTS
ncbi:MAG: MFS transporter [Candidatus Saccharibacteria bacterium]|nr:MFS transporter [Candidatus Saccharibacteria bacterium]